TCSKSSWGCWGDGVTSTYPEKKLLKKAVRRAIKSRNPIPSLSDLARNKSHSSLIEPGRQWQTLELGLMIESVENGVQSVAFSFHDNAVAVVQDMQRKSVVGKITSINRSDWIAFAALIVSVIALFRPAN